MSKEECWRATLVDRMHGRNVKAKELQARANLSRNTLSSYIYTGRQPCLYNGLRILDALGVTTVQAALAWYDEGHEEVMY